MQRVLRAAPVPLRDGDSFMIGSHRFVFHQPSDHAREEETYQEPTDVLVVERMISILVIDIRNYTGLARELGESRVTEVMNKLFHESGKMLKERGSWAQKYIGDAVMAFWVHSDHKGRPREVVQIFDSLLELTAIVEGLNGEFELPSPLRFGAGVNSGLAVTGNMGSAGLQDHTAMGDAVNKAFRLETASKEVGRQIVLGASTYGLINIPDSAVPLFSSHMVLLKGYDAPEEVHALDMADVPKLLNALRA